MKGKFSKIATLVALSSVVQAQNNLFAEFGSCTFSSCRKEAASCCKFVQ